MKEHIVSGKVLAKQYNEVCMMIANITERMGEEWEMMYEMAYKARNMDMLPDKNALKTSPVENVAILLEKMRNEMEVRYCHQVAELERKKKDIEGIVQSANLSAMESRVFYLRYGMRAKMLRIDEIADMVFYSERNVKRILDGGHEKLGRVV